MYNFQHMLDVLGYINNIIKWNQCTLDDFEIFEYISFFIVMFHNIKTRFVKVNVTKSIDIIISLPFLRIHYFSLYTTYNNYEIQWISMNSKDFNIVKSFSRSQYGYFLRINILFLSNISREWNIFFMPIFCYNQYFLSHKFYEFYLKLKIQYD